MTALCLGSIYYLLSSFRVSLRLVCRIVTCLTDLISDILHTSYGPFASSACAGQSLMRKSLRLPFLPAQLDNRTPGNLAATAFPLFTQQMFAALTYKWGNTLFGVIAVLMIPIPFVSSPQPIHQSY